VLPFSIEKSNPSAPSRDCLEGWRNVVQSLRFCSPIVQASPTNELEKQTSSGSAHRDRHDVGNLSVATRRNTKGSSLGAVSDNCGGLGDLRSALCQTKVGMLAF